MRLPFLCRIPFLLSVIFSLLSCGEDRSGEFIEMTQENQWTYSTMKEHYLWGDSIKKPAYTAFFTSESKFYASLLNKNDKVSFFTDSVSAGSYGVSYALMRDPLGIKRTKVYALILDVEKESPADIAGLKRGMWVSSVDGKELSISGTSLLASGGDVVVETERMVTDGENNRFWETDESLPMQASRELHAHAFPLDTVYEIDDRKIGYLMCNNFDGDDFIVHMNGILMNFLSEGVSDFVIDLRYNSGGSMTNAAAMAALFVEDAFQGTAFAVLKGKGDEESTSFNYPVKEMNAADAGLYIITGNATNSTAELFVTSLKVSRGAQNVTLFGERTAGAHLMTEKFVSPYGFAINPAVAIVCSSDGMPLSILGIQTDYEIDELADIENIHELGDIDETVLNSALMLIVYGEIPDAETGTISHKNLFPGRKGTFGK